MHRFSLILSFFFFNDTATTEIYTLSLHDALPIYCPAKSARQITRWAGNRTSRIAWPGSRKRRHCHACWFDHNQLHCASRGHLRSEEHTSELQSRQYLVCRLLLEKKTENRSDQCRQ